MVILGIWKSESETWGLFTAEKAKSSSFSSSSEEISEPIYCSLPCLQPDGGGVDGCNRCRNEGLISGWRVGKEGDGSNSASCFVYALVYALAPELEGAVAEGRESVCDMKGQNSPTRDTVPAVDNHRLPHIHTRTYIHPPSYLSLSLS